MANTYDIGDMVRITATFTTAAGAAIDPTAITMRLKVPSGTVTTYTYGVDAALVKDSTGAYHLDYITLASGAHHYEFTGTGAAVASEPGWFHVRRNAINGA